MVKHVYTTFLSSHNVSNGRDDQKYLRTLHLRTTVCCRRIAVADNAESELTLVTLVAIDNEPVSLKNGSPLSAFAVNSDFVSLDPYNLMIQMS